MLIPKKVRIGGIDYKVIFKDNPLSDGGKSCYGLFDSEGCKIELNSDVGFPHERMCLTFLHEILHGVMFNTGEEFEDEEKLVRVLSRGLYQVIQDNPRIFESKK